MQLRNFARHGSCGSRCSCLYCPLSSLRKCNESKLKNAFNVVHRHIMYCALCVHQGNSLGPLVDTDIYEYRMNEYWWMNRKTIERKGLQVSNERLASRTRGDVLSAAQSQPVVLVLLRLLVLKLANGYPIRLLTSTKNERLRTDLWCNPIFISHSS